MTATERAISLPEKARREGGVFLGMKGTGKSYAGKSAVVEVALDADERVTVIDPTGVWWGLRAKPDGVSPAYPVVIFGGDHADVPITQKSGEAIAKLIVERHFACVIDLSDLTIGGQTRFMTGFLDALYHGNRKPITIVFDEADLFAPQRPLPDQTVMLHRMEQIFRRGRVRGFRPWSITQRPAELHKSVLSQAATLIAMKLMAPHDRKAVMEWIKGQPQLKDVDKVLASIPRLSTGEGWVWCPAQDVLERGRFPKIKTFDSSRTPEEGDEHAPLPRLNDAVLADLADSLKEIEDEAVAADPKIRRARPARAQPTPKEEQVDRQEAEALAQENTLLKDEIRELRDRLEARDRAAVAPFPIPKLPPLVQPTPVTPADQDFEATYAAIKARLLAELPSDPVLFKLLVQKPELMVEVTRKVVQIDGTSLRGRVARLLAEGFFDDGKKQTAVRNQLKRTGPDVNDGNLYQNLKGLVADGFLTLEGDKSYHAVQGMKVNVVERP